MRTINLLLFLLLLYACRPAGPGELRIGDIDLTSEWSTEQIDSLTATFRHFPNNTEFSIALIDDSLTRYYGLLRRQDTLLRIENADRVFEIGSISKVFTAYLLTQLATGGRLTLKDPIQEYLPFPLNDTSGVTFEQLANHTSGLPRLPPDLFWSSIFNSKNPYKNYDRDKLETYLREKMELISEPGIKYRYSNLGAGVLGYILTRIEDKSYESLLQEKVFQPLGMANSTTDRSRIIDRLVTGLDQYGRPTSNWDLAALAGAGAILSSVKDLSRFAQLNLQGEDPAIQLLQGETFSIDKKMSMALGWHILKRDSGATWHWHNGGTGGYRSSFGLDVERQKAVIILTNISAGHEFSKKIDQLCFTLLEESDQ